MGERAAMAVSENTIRQIVEAISSRRMEIVDFIKALVSIPTENPPGASYRTCVDVIANKIHELGLNSTIIEVSPEGEQQKETPKLGSCSYPRYCLQSFYGSGKKRCIFTVITMLYLHQAENNSNLT